MKKIKVNVEFTIDDIGDIDIKPTKRQIEIFLKYVLDSIPVHVIYESGIKLRNAKNVKVKVT